jgi:hypothetical protein
MDNANRTAFYIAKIKNNTEVMKVLETCTDLTIPHYVASGPPVIPSLIAAGAIAERKIDSGGGWSEPANGNVSSTARRCDIDIISGDSLQLNDVLLHYVSIGRPVLIRYSKLPKWKAYQNWRRAPFLKRFGSHLFPVTAIPFFYATELSDADRTRLVNSTAFNNTTVPSSNHRRPQHAHVTPDGRTQMTLRDYVAEYMTDTNNSTSNSNLNSNPNYSNSNSIPTPYIFSSRDIPDALWADIELPPPLHTIERARSGNGANIPIEVRQFGIGPAGSGSPPHFHLPAFNLLVFGRKRWWFWSPQHAYFSTRHITRELPRMIADSHNCECVQEAGDVVFVPHHYGHAVYNERASLCAAFEVFS